MEKVFFHSADAKIDLKNRSSVKKLVVYVFKLERIKLQRIDYMFCSDNYLFRINYNHLNHNNLTDVITFQYSERQSLVISEIYLSTARIKENAKKFNVSYQNELLRVIIHAALHLCGYLDKTTAAQKAMRLKEDFYLNYYVSREANF